MLSFVLSRQPIKEFDERVTLLTRDMGKITAHIRGVKKMTSKNSAYLEPFFLINADLVPGKDGWVLTRAVPVVQFTSFIGDLSVSFVLRRTLLLVAPCIPDREKDSRIFTAFLDFYDALHQEISPVFAADRFVYRFFSLQGYEPRINECFCGDRLVTHFDIPCGGGVCRQCAGSESVPFSADHQAAFRAIQTSQHVSGGIFYDETRSLLRAFLEYYVGTPILSWWTLPLAKEVTVR